MTRGPTVVDINMPFKPILSPRTIKDGHSLTIEEALLHPSKYVPLQEVRHLHTPTLPTSPNPTHQVELTGASSEVELPTWTALATEIDSDTEDEHIARPRKKQKGQQILHSNTNEHPHSSNVPSHKFIPSTYTGLQSVRKAVKGHVRFVSPMTADTPRFLSRSSPGKGVLKHTNASADAGPKGDPKGIVFDGVVISKRKRSSPAQLNSTISRESFEGKAIDIRSTPTKEAAISAASPAADTLVSALSSTFARNSHFNSDTPISSLPAAAQWAPQEPRQYNGRALRRLSLLTPEAGEPYWIMVDQALETKVAPIVVLPEYKAPVGNWGETIIGVTLRNVMQNFIRPKGKGKEAVNEAFTVPSFSHIGELKTRLDTLFGPGDINRGLGKRPTNMHYSSTQDDRNIHPVASTSTMHTSSIGAMEAVTAQYKDSDAHVIIVDEEMPDVNAVEDRLQKRR